jgi:hypothetical protein
VPRAKTALGVRCSIPLDAYADIRHQSTGAVWLSSQGDTPEGKAPVLDRDGPARRHWQLRTATFAWLDRANRLNGWVGCPYTICSTLCCTSTFVCRPAYPLGHPKLSTAQIYTRVWVGRMMETYRKAHPHPRYTGVCPAMGRAECHPRASQSSSLQLGRGAQIPWCDPVRTCPFGIFPPSWSSPRPVGAFLV